MKNIQAYFHIMGLLLPCFIQAQCIPCDNLPDNSHESLDIYYERDSITGIGGRGCWAHPHPNGTDYVITPFSWGSNPNPGKQGLIDLTMQGISDARTAYQGLGNIQTHLYYILRDFDPDASRAGEAFWPLEDGCWMHSGVRNVRSLSNEQFKFIVAHEVGHCFIMDNISAYKPNYKPELDYWMDESMAEFLASYTYPNLNMEHRYIYNMDELLHREPYRAYSFFQHQHHQAGIESILPLMRSIFGKKPETVRLAYFRNSGLDEAFHDYLYSLHKGDIPDIGGGYLPGGNTRYPIKTLELSTEEDHVVLDGLKAQSGTLFDLIIPANYNATFFPIETEPIHTSMIGSIVGREFDQHPFNRYFIVEGLCDASAQIILLASHFENREVINGVRLNYELEGKLDCDEVAGGNSLDPQSIYNFDYRMNGKIAIQDMGSYNFTLYVNSNDGSFCIDEQSLAMNVLAPSATAGEFRFFVQFPNGSNRYYYQEEEGPQVRVLNTNNTLSNFAEDLLNKERFEEFRNNAQTTDAGTHDVFGNQTRYQGNYQDERFSFTISNEHTPITIHPFHIGFFCGVFQDDVENRNRVITRFESEHFDMEITSFEEYDKTLDGRNYQVQEFPIQPNIQAIEENEMTMESLGERMGRVSEELVNTTPGTLEYIRLQFLQMLLSNNISALMQGRNDLMVDESEIDNWMTLYSAIRAQETTCDNIVCPNSGPTYCNEKDICNRSLGRMEAELERTIRGALLALPRY